ncbi:AUGMIN subunit 8-like isoform X2 [Phragmites australis]|uniref:AUGMIN subunit 8-like isoform X2 n=1 Tax=Phragmites australis TaxID=29695 RepID=UPI002D7828E9|nr:AUGMIN subunit 8-like isoform X2 [Phragmites australis]
MDALKSVVKKAALVDETLRPPLIPSEKHNAFSGRDVKSRYKSGLAAATKTRRCTSPSLGRTSATEDIPGPQRAQSADRGRPSTPSTPSSRVSTPSTPTSRSITPVRDTITGLRKSSKCIVSTRAPDGLWPAMQNLSSSFRSESVAAPTNKKDKIVSGSCLDRTKGKVSVLTERKKSPFRRKNIGEQCENAQPSEEPPKRVIEQHWWPAMISRHRPTNLMSRSIDLSDKATRSVPLSNTSRGLSPRKIPASEVARRLVIQASRRDDEVDSGNNIHSHTTQRSKSVSRPNRTVTFPVPVLHRPSSPSKVLSTASSSSRTFQSPSRTRPSTPCRSQSAGTIQSGVTSPVTNYMVDVKKVKKNASQIENIHQLRLLYNRYLQWLFINARAGDILSFQKTTVESTIYNVWRNTLNLWDAVNVRRIMVQHLQQELRLYNILKEQVRLCILNNGQHLKERIVSLYVEQLRLLKQAHCACQLHREQRNAVSSAIDVMQGLGSSVCCMDSKVVDRTSLVSELSVIAGQEKVTLDECRELLAVAAKLQVQESSLRTHLMQQRH